jgi:glycine/D-amino acid oxidase-like deaminating enzyme
MRVGDVSFWYADIGLPPPRAPLPGDTTADICIIGAGYTGLWTAWYLQQARPDLNILIVEKHFAGFGASGRNGGWLTGGFAWNHQRYLANGGEAAVRAMVTAMNGTVDEVIRVAEANAIDADILRTDELMVATGPAQLARLQAEVAHRRHWGEEGRVHEIGAEVQDRIRIPGAIGAMVVQNVARVQPAKLVQGLARIVEGNSVRIAEGTTVTGIAKGVVTTDHGTIRAPIILRCTEGFTASLPGEKRTWLPLNSAQIVTEPLPP